MAVYASFNQKDARMPLVIEIKVVPSAGTQKCIINKQGKLTCYVKSPPEDGKANQELIKFFAKTLKIPQAEVRIVAGLTSRNKKISLAPNFSREEVLEALGLEVQRALL